MHPARRQQMGWAAGHADKKTGSDAAAVFMPAPQVGAPMTYQPDGRQYIVRAISVAITAES